MFQLIWHVDGTDEIFNLHVTDSYETKDQAADEIRWSLKDINCEDWVYVLPVMTKDEVDLAEKQNHDCEEYLADEFFISLRDWLDQ